MYDFPKDFIEVTEFVSKRCKIGGRKFDVLNEPHILLFFNVWVLFHRH